jgi:hypothetical protein
MPACSIHTLIFLVAHRAPATCRAAAFAHLCIRCKAIVGRRRIIKRARKT